MSVAMTQEICSFCSFFDENYGTCNQLHVKILDHPKKFNKCHGDYFFGIGNVSIGEILFEKNFKDKYFKRWHKDTSQPTETLQVVNRMNRSSYLPLRVLHLICICSLVYMYRDFTKIMIPLDLIAIGVFYVLFFIDCILVVSRLHDLGRPGYHYFLSWIPFYNLYFYSVLFFKEGEGFDNRYGENTVGNDSFVEDSLETA